MRLLKYCFFICLSVLFILACATQTAGPKIDPVKEAEAVALMMHVMENYRSLDSYSDTISVHYLKDDFNHHDSSDFSYLAPGKWKLNNSGRMQISDSENIRLVSFYHNQYTEEPVDSFFEKILKEEKSPQISALPYLPVHPLLNLTQSRETDIYSLFPGISSFLRAEEENYEGIQGKRVYGIMEFDGNFGPAFSLFINSRTGLVEEILIDNECRIRFKNIKINEPIDENNFQLNAFGEIQKVETLFDPIYENPVLYTRLGDPVSPFSVTTKEGKTLNLPEMLENGPVLLYFQNSQWGMDIISDQVWLETIRKEKSAQDLSTLIIWVEDKYGSPEPDQSSTKLKSQNNIYYIDENGNELMNQLQLTQTGETLLIGQDSTIQNISLWFDSQGIIDSLKAMQNGKQGYEDSRKKLAESLTQGNQPGKRLPEVEIKNRNSVAVVTPLNQGYYYNWWNSIMFDYDNDGNQEWIVPSFNNQLHFIDEKGKPEKSITLKGINNNTSIEQLQPIKTESGFVLAGSFARYNPIGVDQKSLALFDSEGNNLWTLPIAPYQNKPEEQDISVEMRVSCMESYPTRSGSPLIISAVNFEKMIPQEEPNTYWNVSTESLIICQDLSGQILWQEIIDTRVEKIIGSEQETETGNNTVIFIYGDEKSYIFTIPENH